MTKETIPLDFTLGLALFDALPVIFFGISIMVIAGRFSSLLFLLGAALCFMAGFSKVLWKIIVVTKKKNVWVLFIQMRTIMPASLVLMLLGVFTERKSIEFGKIFSNVCTWPIAAFFAFGLIAMLLMAVFAFTLDASKTKSNWIEQITNCFAQLMILMGILMYGK